MVYQIFIRGGIFFDHDLAVGPSPGNRGLFTILEGKHPLLWLNNSGHQAMGWLKIQQRLTLQREKR